MSSTSQGSNMKIDWFTVVAQLLNFIILLWLMKRFLFKPILNAIDAREKKIADKLAHAEAKKAEAHELKAEYELKSDNLDAQSASFLKTAQEEGQAEKLRLMEQAREDAEIYAAKRREAILDEEKVVRQALRQKTQDEVLAVTRKVLADLAGASLDERVVEVFTERLSNLSDAEIKTLSSALKTPSDVITVRTAFEISSDLQSTTALAVKKIVGSDSIIKFETSPKLISGIELSVNGQKVAWSVADYLSSLEESLSALPQEQGKAKKLKSKKKAEDDEES